jgi:hypothetical protein
MHKVQVSYFPRLIVVVVLPPLRLCLLRQVQIYIYKGLGYRGSRFSLRCFFAFFGAIDLNPAGTVQLYVVSFNHVRHRKSQS